MPSTSSHDAENSVSHLCAPALRVTLTDLYSSQSDKGQMTVDDLGDSIDVATFEQILEMDDDEDEHEFSKSIVFGFFDQAEQTFKDMDDAL